MSFRDKVVDELYRSIRDALNSFMWTRREKNNVIFYLEDKKITVSFRIKIEETDVTPISFYDAVEPND
tara:strand:- start:489 stop:692 length:204 start_codon:yes stop_codon:yes gene_type:complete